jgi:uncharacterized protein (TIGR02217 family)
MTQAFHDVLFPFPLALAGRGGPQRKTEIVVQGSGHEQRLSRWRHARRRYEIGSGLKTRQDLMRLVDFFEARRGRFYGFRFHDPLDGRSVSGPAAVSALDQNLGVGDGATAQFQLRKAYGQDSAVYWRPILKPCKDTVRVAINGTDCVEGHDFTCDTTNGQITFMPVSIPPKGALVTAGFLFDVPVRFETDTLDLAFDALGTGEVPSIILLELLN